MELLHQFLELMVTERGATRSTISSYEADLCNFYGFLKNKKIECGTFQDIQSYLLTQNHLSAATVRRRLSSLRQFYIFLMSRDLIKDNPFSLMESVPPKPRPINERNVERLLEGAKMWAGPEGKRLSALLQILYATDIPVKNLVSLPFSVTLPSLNELMNSKYPSPALSLREPATSPTRGEVILRPTLLSSFDVRRKTKNSMDTSPLVGEVAQRAGEGYYSTLHTFLAEGWWYARNGDRGLGVLALEALQEYLKVRNYFLTHGKESPWLFPSLSQKGHLTRQRFGQLLKELSLKVGLDSKPIFLPKI